MSNALRVLEQAITDIGHWRWWVRSDAIFQVEFGWVMLLVPLKNAGDPPTNAIALGFNNPWCVVVLQRSTEGSGLPDDWFTKLGQDELEPLNVDHENFTLTDVHCLHSIYQNADRRDFIVGNEEDMEGIAHDHAFLAFWAQDAGLIVISERMDVLSHRGRMEIEEIAAKHAAWWEYWREYWDRIDSDDPLPYDPLCEVTIPLAE